MPLAARVDAGGVDVGGPDVRTAPRFEQEHGQRAGLGSVGAPGVPHAGFGPEAGDHQPVEVHPAVGVTEEGGDVDGEAIEQGPTELPAALERHGQFVEVVAVLVGEGPRLRRMAGALKERRSIDLQAGAARRRPGWSVRRRPQRWPRRLGPVPPLRRPSRRSTRRPCRAGGRGGPGSRVGRAAGSAVPGPVEGGTEHRRRPDQGGQALGPDAGGHPVDGAAGAVLGQHLATAVGDRPRPVEGVGAHAREHHRHGAVAVLEGQVDEGEVGPRPEPGDGEVVVEPHPPVLDAQVHVARGDEDLTGPQRRARLRPRGS